MFQKIANALSIISFIMVSSVIAGSYVGYKYVTSENFKQKLLNTVMSNVSGLLPNVLEQGLPSTTGISIPSPKAKEDNFIFPN